MVELNQIGMIVTYTFDWNLQAPPCCRFPDRLEVYTASLYGEVFAWRFSVLGSLVFLGAVFLFAYLIYRVRVRRVEAELTTLFHKRLSERASLAIDLNDSLLQTIEASKLIADDALDSPADLHRTRSAMGRLSYWLGNAIPEGQATLNSLRKASYDGNDLASGFLRAAEEYLIHRPLKCHVNTTGLNREMKPMVRDEVYLLGCEVISKLCKHADSNHLDVALKYGADFSLLVSSHCQMLGSNVVGNRQSDPLGLFDMQRRAQRFGAALSLTNTSSSKVELTLTVPGNIIFTNVTSALPQWLLGLWNRFRSRRGNPS